FESRWFEADAGVSRYTRLYKDWKKNPDEPFKFLECFRVIEPEDIILIDGGSVLFSGPLGNNLDPFNRYANSSGKYHPGFSFDGEGQRQALGTTTAD
ncbi:hypothetical protein CU097_005330, partial [Rhizopus azygosporus]